MIAKAPIVLFVYERLHHAQKTIEALLVNPECSQHDLIVYSDAPRSLDKVKAVDAVRDYLKNIKGFRSITIHHRPKNFGLARSIIAGVTEVLLEYEQIIVMEDDMVTSPHFLAYMNEGLERYADDERVISIHGYVYPCSQALPEAFFLRGADCWGWATWRRGWAIFNPDGKFLLNELRQKSLINIFNFNGSYDYSKMLEGQINGRNDSWAIRWYASAFLADKLTLYPGRSLVYNIGLDGSGTHCSSNSNYNTELSGQPIKLMGLKVEHSELGFLAFERFFRLSKTKLVSRLLSRFKILICKLFG